MYSGAGELVKIEEKWGNSGVIRIDFPMPVQTETRYNNSIAVRRGPLYYAFKIEGLYNKIQNGSRWGRSISYMGSTDWEVYPKSQWNFALAKKQLEQENIDVIENEPSKYPFASKYEMIYQEATNQYVKWDMEAPVVIKVQAKQLPSWGMKDNSADVPPKSPVATSQKLVTVELIPYGCARLRIAEFPYIVLPQ